jgi:hypothetical protein
MMAAAVVALSLLATATAQADVRFRRTDCPVSPQSSAAFKIIGAAGERDGVGSEYTWLKLYMPGWSRTDQLLLSGDNRVFDVLDITDGRHHKMVCFDITDFFGK